MTLGKIVYPLPGKFILVENSNDTVSLIYDINLGEKAKIRKIKFIGDKKYKNRKLFNVIVSEEPKPEYSWSDSIIGLKNSSEFSG